MAFDDVIYTGIFYLEIRNTKFWILEDQNLHLFARKMFYWHPGYLEMHVCAYTMLLLTVLHQFDKRFPIYDESFTKKIVCEEPTENYWSKNYHGCKGGRIFRKIIPFPSEQSNTESESGSSTTETRHHENGRENRHHRKS